MLLKRWGKSANINNLLLLCLGRESHVSSRFIPTIEKTMPKRLFSSHFLVFVVTAIFCFTIMVPRQQARGTEKATVVADLPASSDLPFKPGESFIYELRWGLIPAGQAELKVLPIKEINGVPAWHFQLTIRSNDFIDVFYKVRDRIDAYAALSLDESLCYRQSQQEGRTRREVEVNLFPERSEAIFSNYGESLPPIKIAAGTLDPLTALYFIRSQPLRENLEIIRPITDGKRNVNGEARVLKREEINLNGNRYDTFKIEPNLRGVKGVFEKSEKSRMTIWLTADKQRKLVKITSKVVVGSFSGDLIESN